jgi:predicted membrane metal-binding protein
VRSPAVALAAAFVAGLFLSELSSASPALAAFSAAVLLSTAAALARLDELFCSALVLIAYGLLGLAAGEARALESRQSTLLATYHRLGEKSFEGPARIEGRLRREPELGLDLTLLTLDSETIKIRGATYRAEGGLRARVSGELRGRLGGLAASDRISFWGRLDEPSSFGNDGGFDVRRYFERERLDLTASVKSALLVERDASARSYKAWVSRLRIAATRRLESALGDRSRDTFGVVVALLTGDREKLSPELEELYRDAGIFHVMAISGAQVAIVILVFYFVLRRLGVSEVATLWTLLLVVPVYAAFCGSGPPVVRAALAASVVLGRAPRLDRPHVNTASALLLLLWSRSVETVSAQLRPMAAVLAHRASRERCGLSASSRCRSRSRCRANIVVPITAWHFMRSPGWLRSRA